MNFETITIKDIAKALNISISTVSKALRKSHEISEETQRMVIAYADKHNYHPNPIAQRLRAGVSKTIGVIVSNFDNNFFSQVVNGIESVAQQKGYTTIITQSHESYELENDVLQSLVNRSIDGLLVTLSAETADISHFKALKDKGFPFVFFDRVTDEIETHRVVCNNFLGAYQATEHLIQQGFRKIAHITSSNSLSITLERLEGYLKALEDYNIPENENYIKYCIHGGMIEKETEQAIGELLSLPDRPDAIFTASDRITTTTFSILQRLKIKIPRDIALIGFTNSTSAEIFGPPLSAIIQPSFAMGEAAVKLLIQLIENKRPPISYEKTILDPQLMVRKSSEKG
ncbi:MAG: LacI family DNA-binding transcriptional regulator [Chitinophagaceae bacterium]